MNLNIFGRAKIYVLHIHWPVLNHLFNGKCQHFRENTKHKRKFSRIVSTYLSIDPISNIQIVVKENNGHQIIIICHSSNMSATQGIESITWATISARIVQKGFQWYYIVNGSNYWKENELNASFFGKIVILRDCQQHAFLPQISCQHQWQCHVSLIAR